MKSFMILIVLLLAPVMGWSQSQVMQVKGQNFLFQAGTYKAGDAVTILGVDGQPKGTARVKQAGKNQSVAEILTGSAAIGDQIGPSDQPSLPVSRRTAVAAPIKFQFSAGVGYAATATAKLSGTRNSGFDSSFSAQGKSGSAVYLVFDFRHWFDESYGMIYALDYGMDRKVDSGLVYTDDGFSTTYAMPDKYSNLSLSANFAFRFSSAYLPIGINFNLPKLTTTGSGSMSSSLGYQVGFGYQVNQLAFEVWYKIGNYKIKSDYSDVDGVNFSTATLTELLLTTRWVF